MLCHANWLFKRPPFQCPFVVALVIHLVHRHTSPRSALNPPSFQCVPPPSSLQWWYSSSSSSLQFKFVRHVGMAILGMRLCILIASWVIPVGWIDSPGLCGIQNCTLPSEPWPINVYVLLELCSEHYEVLILLLMAAYASGLHREVDSQPRLV